MLVWFRTVPRAISVDVCSDQFFRPVDRFDRQNSQSLNPTSTFHLISQISFVCRSPATSWQLIVSCSVVFYWRVLCTVLYSSVSRTSFRLFRSRWLCCPATQRRGAVCVSVFSSLLSSHYRLHYGSLQRERVHNVSN